jgi:glycosyltransferase involved in cell wall biosynthesis
MRRVLLIAFFYPPDEAVGSVRPAALAKYLPRFGWEAVVLTPKRQGVLRESKHVIETEYRDVLGDWKARLGLDQERGVHEQFGLPLTKKRGSALPHTRLLEFVKYFLTYPDPYKGWIPCALEALQEIRRRPDLDIAAIVTTGPPISCHLIGRQARKILGCPWVADFRDLWTQNLGDRSFRRLQVGLEKRTLKDADVLVTVSEPWGSRLQQRYPDKKICTITNGFDPDDYCSPPPALTREFSITYTGQLYQGQRDPTVLFEVLRDLVDEKVMSPEDVRVRFYGPIEHWVTTLLRQYRLEEVVEIHGIVTRKEALQRQAESQILLLLGWADPRETGQHSGKLFEYLGAARPILAVGGSRGVLTETLKETHAGTHALSKEEVRNFLVASYREFKTKGYVPYYGDDAAIGRYTHFQMARQFAEVLNLVSRRSRPSVGSAASPVFQTVGK